MTLAAGWATALAAMPLGAVYDNWRWLWYTWAAVGAVVAAQLLARSARLPGWLVPLAGLVGLLEYLVIVFAGNRAFLGLLPDAGAMRALQAGIQSGFNDVHDLAAPVPANPGLVLITAGSVGLVTIAVDIVAVGLRRPAAAGLALLALYAVPTAVALDGVPWPLFVIGATGYLILLMVEGRERLMRWGRPIAPTGDLDDANEDAPVPLTGQRIGAAALAAAVIVPLFIPGLTTNTLSKLGRNGVGDGSGTGSGPLSAFAALKGQLVMPEPRLLFRVTTSSDTPDLWYLREKVLERYTASGWVEGQTRSADALTDPLPLPQAQVTTGSEKPYSATVEVTDQFRDDALPTFYFPDSVTNGPLDGWGYRQQTGVVVAGAPRGGGFRYTVSGYQPDPTVEGLEASQPLPQDNDVMQRLGKQPAVPDLVRKSLEDAIGDRKTPYDKAKAIDDYFTDGQNGFTYSTVTKPGNSGSALVDFLTHRQGYCEQYAAAMAVMLRLAGIPSRVVLGYTHKTKATAPDGSIIWSVLTSDAHAWVEAYFDQIGWVPFDPTPLLDGRTATLPWAPHANLTNATSVPGNGAVTGPSVSGGFGTARRDPNDIGNPNLAPGGRTGVFTPKIALGSVGLLALILLMLSPGLGRVLARRRRLRTAGGADAGPAARAAWDEVLATAEDYRIVVPETETPRRTAVRLAREQDLEGPAAAGLRLAALAEERARYAPVAGVDGDLPTAVRAVRRGMRATLIGRRRWLPVLLPASTLRAARVAAGRRAEYAAMSLSRLGESLRQALIPARLAARRARQ